MHLCANNMADPDISDYELRNNSTVFEERNSCFVDGLKGKTLEPHFYYTDKMQYKIQCKTNKLQNT